MSGRPAIGRRPCFQFVLAVSRLTYPDLLPAEAKLSTPALLSVCSNHRDQRHREELVKDTSCPT